MFSTLRGWWKTTNLERDPRCTVLVYRGDNPYHYLEIRGDVELTDDPTAGLIHELSGKYTGADTFEGILDGRVIVRVRPRKVVWRV